MAAAEGRGEPLRHRSTGRRRCGGAGGAAAPRVGEVGGGEANAARSVCRFLRRRRGVGLCVCPCALCADRARVVSVFVFGNRSRLDRQFLRIALTASPSPPQNERVDLHR